MRVHAPVVAIVFATLGLVAANASSACTFTSTGAGGDAATPSYWEGGNNGSSSGSFGATSSSGSVGSPSGSGGGLSSGSGGPTSSGSGGGTIECGPGSSPCGNACCPNVGAADASSPSTPCTVTIDFESQCENYYSDETSGSLTCNTCVSNANSGGTCNPEGKGGGSCMTTTCEAQCNSSVTCGASCPAQYCPCISACLQSQNTNCCTPVEQTYGCTVAMCSGPCTGAGGG